MIVEDGPSDVVNDSLVVLLQQGDLMIADVD
jgi:hypothetical protein